MRAFRLALFGGVVGTMLGGLRALARGGAPVEVAAHWALAGAAVAVILLVTHALLGRSLEGSRRLAVTLLVGLHVAALGFVASAFVRGGRDPRIAAAILAVLAVVLAPVLWAWAPGLTRYLDRTGPLRDLFVARLDTRGRNGMVLTVAAAVAVAAVVARGLSGP